jgi:hypothetical protein
LQILFHGSGNKFEEKMSFPVGQDILSASITRMNLGEGLKNITVQAIGKLLISSDTVPYNITVSYSKPQKNRKFEVVDFVVSLLSIHE